MWNALAAEALPLVLDRLADPATAIIVSVTVVLLFGEAVLEAIFCGCRCRVCFAAMYTLP